MKLEYFPHNLQWICSESRNVLLVFPYFSQKELVDFKPQVKLDWISAWVRAIFLSIEPQGIKYVGLEAS